MATKRPTLVLWNDSVLAKKIDNTLWVQKNTTPESERIGEEVAKWVVTIKGMTDDVGPDLSMNGANWAVLLAM